MNIDRLTSLENFLRDWWSGEIQRDFVYSNYDLERYVSTTGLRQALILLFGFVPVGDAVKYRLKELDNELRKNIPNIDDFDLVLMICMWKNWVNISEGKITRFPLRKKDNGNG